MRAIPLILVVLALGGCAERWVRPGATLAEGDAANAACRVLARQVVPPALETRVVPASWTRTEHCETRNGRRSCRTSTQYVPERSYQVDLNDRARDEARRGCMEKEGFTYAGLRLLGTE